MTAKRWIALCGWLFSVTLFTPSLYADEADTQARAIFRKLTGTSIPNGDARLGQMAEAIRKGSPEDATAIAVADKNFYNVTLRNWSAPWSSLTGNVNIPLDDMQATAIGIVRDQIDIRLLLTGTFSYRGKAIPGVPLVAQDNNRHYEILDEQFFDLKSTLEKVNEQQTKLPQPVGVFTSRAFTEKYLNAGTNRRAVKHAFMNFMCKPIEAWRDPGLPEGFIRRDVARLPAGDAQTYETECRTCHAPMDALAGAFARYDFDGTKALFFGGKDMAPKYNFHEYVYPPGYITRDPTWINYLTRNQNVAFGWRSELSGDGLAAFAHMLAESRGFSECMVSQAIKAVCRRPLTAADQPIIEHFADELESNGYNLLKIFAATALQPEC